jgi:hypothetical protein
MNVENIKPSENYAELKIQFNALKRIVASKQAQIQVYEKRIKEFSADRIIQLEAELESEKEMNSALTKELISKTK